VLVKMKVGDLVAWHADHAPERELVEGPSPGVVVKITRHLYDEQYRTLAVTVYWCQFNRSSVVARRYLVAYDERAQLHPRGTL